ncbi:MAG TPA: NAD(P)/FAD-dependent oxidoreductase [Thermoanaerobaculia bacterium]|nr:NAD(P)/FAD-dependent oxidoreductase [Thermoanaerobaculia bacterium]
MGDATAENPIDVAIFGGGAAGTYAAYRLMTTPLNDRLDVRLFERSDRIGGRLWSYRFEGFPEQPAELGGMAFHALHQNVYGLCKKELGLKLEPFLPFCLSNVQYLRGHRFLANQYWCSWAVPYLLAGPLLGNNPNSLVINAMTQAIPGLGQRIAKLVPLLQQRRLAAVNREMNELVAFLRTARIAALPPEEADLWRHGFWNFFQSSVGSEAQQLAADASFATSSFRSYNLYDLGLAALQMFFCYLFPAGKEDPLPAFYTPADGYGALPQVLAQRFEQSGGKVCLGHQLSAIRPHGELLALTVGAPGKPGETAELYARHVILAMPKRSLQLIQIETAGSGPEELARSLETVTGIPAGKLFSSYRRPWWKSIDSPSSTPMQGASLTDLPLRAIYYMHAGKRGALLCSLSDEENACFWEAFRAGSRFGMSGQKAPAGSLSLAAPPLMVEEARRELAAVHGCPVPSPQQSVFVNWTEDPYGGGWHMWNPYLRSWEEIPRIRKPFDLNLYICGEAYSAWQGWVEGAFNTTEMVLETWFGLPRPAWVLPNYEFGP